MHKFRKSLVGKGLGAFALVATLGVAFIGTANAANTSDSKQERTTPRRTACERSANLNARAGTRNPKIDDHIARAQAKLADAQSAGNAEQVTKLTERIARLGERKTGFQARVDKANAKCSSTSTSTSTGANT